MGDWLERDERSAPRHRRFAAAPPRLREGRQWSGLVSGRSRSPSPFADHQRVADAGRLRPGEDQRRKRLHATRRLDLDGSWHTYGIGFHKVHGLGATLDLDAALARGVRLIAPAESQ